MLFNFQIKRIENVPMYSMFLINKAHVEHELKVAGCALPVTRTLYHGTRRVHLDGICSKGPNRSLAGSDSGFFACSEEGGFGFELRLGGGWRGRIVWVQIHPPCISRV